MNETTGTTRKLFARRLRPVPPRLRMPVLAAWGLFFVIALASIVGGGWLGWQSARDISPAFYQLGLSWSDDYDGAVEVDALTPAVRASGPTWPGHILTIDGKPVPANPLPLARALAGPPGKVRLVIDDDLSKMPITLERSPTVQIAATGSTSPVAIFLLDTGIPLVVALVLLGCATLIFARRRDDPVALLLSATFLCGVAALVGTPLWCGPLGLAIVDTATTALFFGILIAIIPAFPDGEYRTRTAFGIALSAIPLTLLGIIVDDATFGDLITALELVLILALIVMQFRRFRRTPPGLERQQLKWAAAGFSGASVVLLVAAAIYIAHASGAFPPSWNVLANYTIWSLSVFSLAVLAVGTTISILRIRPWDADRAFGKTFGLGAATIMLSGIWAAGLIIANELITAFVGGGNKAAAAAASTVVAAAVIAPARTRTTKWIDQRFQGGVLALKALPDQIATWQRSDTPEDLGQRVIAALARPLNASRGALLVWSDDGFVPVAAQGVEAHEIDAWLAGWVQDGGTLSETAAEDPLFPIRLPLSDGRSPVGLVLVGGRPEGAGLPGDLRGALHGLETPVAAALRRIHRMVLRDETILQKFRALEERLARLEQAEARSAG